MTVRRLRTGENPLLIVVASVTPRVPCFRHPRSLSRVDTVTMVWRLFRNALRDSSNLPPPWTATVSPVRRLYRESGRAFMPTYSPRSVTGDGSPERPSSPHVSSPA